VILEFDGHPVESAGALPSLVVAAKPGSKVKATIWRDHARRDVELTLAATTDGEAVASNDSSGAGGRLGLSVRPLSAAERGANHGEDGLLVVGVTGAAAEAGLRPGDVVLSANGKPVHAADQLRAAVAGAKKHVALLVQRGDARIFVPVELG
jgi:serine protease Do